MTTGSKAKAQLCPDMSETLSLLVRFTDQPLADKLAAIGKLFDKKQLKVVASNRQHAAAIKGLLQDDRVGNGALPAENLDVWHQKFLSAITSRGQKSPFGRDPSPHELGNLIMLDCAVLSQAAMRIRRKDFWNVLAACPPVTHDVVEFFRQHWVELFVEDFESEESGTSTPYQRSVLAYLLGQPRALIMDTFVASFGCPLSSELEDRFPFLALVRLLCRRDPDVLQAVSGVLYTSADGKEAALRELLPLASEPCSRPTDEARAALFMVLCIGCSPDPAREVALLEADLMGCLIAWGLGGLGVLDRADHGCWMLAEEAPQLVLERVRGCSDTTAITRTLKALRQLDLKDPDSVNDFVVCLLQVCIGEDWPSATNSVRERQVVVSFMQALPAAFRNPRLPGAVVLMLKDAVVKFVEGTAGLATPHERYELVRNLCYDDSLVIILPAWYIKFLCGQLHPRQDSEVDPWDSGSGLDDYILPAILGNPESDPPREGALSRFCPGADQINDTQRTAMVEVLGQITLSSRWLAIFALRIACLITVLDGRDKGTKPQLTWGDQETRQFLDRVFGTMVTTTSVWFRSYSWKDIQEQLFDFAVHWGGAIASIRRHVSAGLAFEGRLSQACKLPVGTMQHGQLRRCAKEDSDFGLDGLVVLACMHKVYQANECTAWVPWAVQRQVEAVGKWISITPEGSHAYPDEAMVIHPVIECSPSLKQQFVEAVLLEFPVPHCHGGFQVVVMEDGASEFKTVPANDWMVHDGSVWVRRYHFCQVGIKFDPHCENEYSLDVYRKPSEQCEGGFEVSFLVHLPRCVGCRATFQKKCSTMSVEGWHCISNWHSTVDAADEASLHIVADSQGCKKSAVLKLESHTKKPFLADLRFHVPDKYCFTLELRPSNPQISWTLEDTEHGLVMEGPPLSTYKEPGKITERTQLTDALEVIFQQNFENTAKTVKLYDKLDYLRAQLGSVNPEWLLVNSHGSGEGPPELVGCWAYSFESGKGVIAPWQELEQLFRHHIQTRGSKLKFLVIVCCYSSSFASTLQKLGVDVVAWIGTPETGLAHHFAVDVMNQYKVSKDPEASFQNALKSQEDYLDLHISVYDDAHREGAKTVELFRCHPRLLVVCPNYPPEGRTDKTDVRVSSREWEKRRGDAWVVATLAEDRHPYERVEFVCLCTLMYYTLEEDHDLVSTLRKSCPGVQVVIFSGECEILRRFYGEDLEKAGILVLPPADVTADHAGGWNYITTILDMLLSKPLEWTSEQVSNFAGLLAAECAARESQLRDVTFTL